MNLKQFAEEHGTAAGFLASLLAIGAFGWGVFTLFFAPPDLSLTLETTPLRLPWYTYQQMSRALDRDSARLSDSSGLALRQVRGFLRDTRSFTHVRITNTSDRSLQNLDVRLRNVREADGYGIDADNLNGEEQDQLLASIRYDAPSQLLTLRSIPRLPPQSSLSIYVWGDVSSAIFGDDPLTVTYDGGAGRVLHVTTVRGVDAFIYENAATLVLILVLFNLLAWMVYEDKRSRARKRRADARAGESSS